MPDHTVITKVGRVTGRIAPGTRVKGEAERAAIHARLTGEAEGIEARAKALERNQEAVTNSTIPESLPQIVRAAASSPSLDSR